MSGQRQQPGRRRLPRSHGAGARAQVELAHGRVAELGGQRLRRRETDAHAVADRGSGPVAVSVYPWEITLAPEHAADPGSARNHLPVEVVSITAVGNRVRVGLAHGRVAELDLRPGSRAVASWKAAATRLLPLTAHQTVSDSSS